MDEHAFGLPMTLTVGLVGKAQEEPPYVEAGPPPSNPGTPVNTPSASTPAGDPGSPSASPPASENAGDPPRDDTGDGQPVALIAVLIGAAVVLVGGGTGLLVRLRRGH